ncbi:MAG TPA: hypothetical protein PLS73_10715 [Saprospiraceae bacterium]|nr:hypothetical protein [Saprospiraceae bacterium]
MLKKINILEIIKNHFGTLINDNSNKREFDDYLTFLILPIIFATGLVYYKIALSEQIINIVITALSIFVGLLFNVVVLLFDIVKRDSTQRLKNKVLKQILANITFTILLSLVTILFTVLTFIDESRVKLVAIWFVYFLLSNFLFTVLMILKRMYILFKNEIDCIENSENL